MDNNDTAALPSWIPELDLYLFDRGEAQQAYRVFGCHPGRLLPDGASTHRFVVWAPHARSVHVVGDFNDWDCAAHALQLVHEGVWAGEIPGLADGDIYKYAIEDPDGTVSLKADPFAFHAENGLHTASKVWDLAGYAWQDEAWMQARAMADPLHSPLSIYELHLGSWRLAEGETYPNYRAIAHELAAYCVEMGYTHVELMPVTEYPLPASWGYQVTGYYAPSSRYGTPQDFMALVDTLHDAGIGVILDWVPAHFPRDSFALARFDGTPQFEYADPRKGEHGEWGTLVFDYAKPQVVSFLVSSAMYFLDVYHVDGIRVDAVSSMLYLDYGRDDWVPNEKGGNINLEAVEFLRTLNAALLSKHPGAITIAEESTAYPLVTKPPFDGGLGFSFKWDMGFMHDMIDYCEMDPLFRSGNHEKLTFGMMYAFSENFVLAFSHDEVVHGKKSMVDKMHGSYEQKFATLRALMGWQFGRPGKKLTFMGSEFAQFIEWDYQKQLDWMLLDYPQHAAMRRYSAALNRFYREHAALWRIDDGWDGFMWANVDDCDESAIACLRRAHDGSDDILLCCNFTPNELRGFTVGLPCEGTLQELLNSDKLEYGGTGVGNARLVRTRHVPFDGQPHSAQLLLPPLSAVFFRFHAHEGDGMDAGCHEQTDGAGGANRTGGAISAGAAGGKDFALRGHTQDGARI